jgi:4-hydroxy 2-oxovalerate aldolase
VDCIELGYRNSKSLLPAGEYGLYKYSNDNDIRDITGGVASKLNVSLMADAGRVEVNDVKPADQSPVHMIRVAAYVKDAAEAVKLTRNFANKGYETTINIMAISRDRGPELTSALQRISEESPAGVVYIVDSFGALKPGDTAELVDRFKACLPGKAVGFHGHNNQQLAFANTLEAIRQGASYADGTVFGMGRAAGNCPLELLIGHLDDPRYELGPVLDLIAKEILPLRETMEWGYIIPYALTGLMNLHPRSAMALRKGQSRDEYRSFYESIRDPREP